MHEELLGKLHNATIDAGLGTRDNRVYALIGLANAVLAGHNITPGQRESMKNFPNSLALLDWAASRRVETNGRRLTHMHATPGPNAEVESFAKAWLDGLNDADLQRENEPDQPLGL